MPAPFTRTSLVIAAVLGFAWQLPGLSEEDMPQVEVKTPKAGDTRDDNALKLVLVWCPPGKFTMGSPPDEEDRGADEDQVSVTLRSGFWLGQTEVTQKQWKALMDTEPWKDEDDVQDGDDYPVVYVSWKDATEFCRKLTDQERKAGRLTENEEYTLPTEAQWEYACRAGTTSRFSFGDDEGRLGDFGWFQANAEEMGEAYAHKVRLKEPNPWGLSDMHGNVYEWCSDNYVMDILYSPDSHLLDSMLNEFGVDIRLKAFRGGSCGAAPRDCRTADRDWNEWQLQFSYVGFRVARSPIREPIREGDQVVTIRHASVRSGDEITGEVPKGNLLIVEEVRGYKLDITVTSATEGTLKGWVSGIDVIRLEDAIDWFDSELKRNPTADTFALRGTMKGRQGELDAAIADYNESLRLDPHLDIVYLNRGLAWANKGEYDRAIADYDEAIRRDSKNTIAFRNRGSVWCDKKEYDRAIADYNEAISLDPEFKEAYLNRGFVWYRKGDNDRAIADYNESIRLDPKDSLS